MLSYSSSVIPFFVSVFISLCSTGALVKLPENGTIPAVIVFGDSIVDAGNNNNLVTVAKSNYPPYGRDFSGGIPTGRFSNGKIPSDFIGCNSHSSTLSSIMHALFSFPIAQIPLYFIPCCLRRVFQRTRWTYWVPKDNGNLVYTSIPFILY